MLKRGYMGTYHDFSAKHSPRYIKEFSSRQYLKGMSTLVQMVAIVRGLDGRGLRYRKLVVG